MLSGERYRPGKTICRMDQTNKFHGFIGEYGIPDNDPRWNETLDLFLGYLQETESMVHIGLRVRGGIAISWQSPPKTGKTDRKCLSLRNIQVLLKIELCSKGSPSATFYLCFI